MTKGRGGNPELRADYGEKTCPPPCRTEKGCPKGTPEKPRSLTSANEECFEHYQECRAVGSFPDDPIVRRNAAIIRAIEDEVERIRDRESQQSLLREIRNGLI